MVLKELFVASAILAPLVFGSTAHQNIGAPIPFNQLTRLDERNEPRQEGPTSPVSGATLSSTVFLIPIATVCPADSNPQAPFLPVTLPTVTLSNITASIVSATAILPDGSTTTYESRQKRSAMTVANAMQAQATQLPDGTSAYPLGDASENEAQLVAGLDGCQTLYMPTSTAICSTIVTPAGLPPVTVSECDQLVTFSSQTFMTCYADASATPVATNLGSFTTRPFSRNDSYEDATTTYTPGANVDDGTSTSSANRVRRQILISGGKPMMTDLATVAPPADVRAEKRQIMISNGRPVMTDLATVAPTMQAEKRHITRHSAESKTRKYPNSHAHPKDRPLLMVSGVTGLLSINATTNVTMNATGVAASAGAPVTSLLPIPSALQAKYRRKKLVDGHHKRAEDAVPEVQVRDDSSGTPNTVMNATVNSTALHASMNKLGSSIKVAGVGNAAAMSPPQPTRYWAAPWQAIANGGVPNIVYDITCYGGMLPLGECSVPDSDGDMEKCECTTITESWSVSTYTVTRYGTTALTFDGPVAVTLADGRTTKTTLSFTDTFSTTATFQQEIVVTSQIGADTVTATLTTTPSATISLLDNSAQTTDVKAIMAGAPQDAPSSQGDLPTTIYVTNTVATETVTVDPTDLPSDVPVPDGSDGTGEADPASTPVSSRHKRDNWPADVLLTHMADFKQNPHNDKRSLFEDLVLSRLVTTGNPDACARSWMRTCMEADLPQACSSIDDCPADLLVASLNMCESSIPQDCQSEHKELMDRDLNLDIASSAHFPRKRNNANWASWDGQGGRRGRGGFGSGSHQRPRSTTTSRSSTTSVSTSTSSSTTTSQTCPTAVFQSCLVQLQSGAAVTTDTLRSTLALCLIKSTAAASCQNVIQQLLGTIGLRAKREEVTRPKLQLSTSSTPPAVPTGDGYSCPATTITVCYASLQTMKFKDSQAMKNHLAACLAQQGADQCQTLIDKLLGGSQTKRQIGKIGVPENINGCPVDAISSCQDSVEDMLHYDNDHAENQCKLSDQDFLTSLAKCLTEDVGTKCKTYVDELKSVANTSGLPDGEEQGMGGTRDKRQLRGLPSLPGLSLLSGLGKGSSSGSSSGSSTGSTGGLPGLSGI